MTTLRQIAALSLLSLAACGGRTGSESIRAYDLNITHPAPYANYLRVAPMPGSDRAPRLSEIKGRSFSHYLRARTGCVVNPAYAVTPLGHRRMPAGYMVPVTCG